MRFKISFILLSIVKVGRNVGTAWVVSYLVLDSFVQKLRLFGQWEGHRCCGADGEGEEPWFRVQKACGSLRRSQSSEACTVRVGCGTCFKIDGWAHKSEYRIKSMDGEVVAEVKRKQTTNGVVLGEDVLSLVVEPSVDHLLIMGLVVVCGLINHCM